MKALRKVAPGVGHVELCDVPVPEIGPDDVLMRVYAAQQKELAYSGPTSSGL